VVWEDGGRNPASYPIDTLNLCKANVVSFNVQNHLHAFAILPN